MALQPSSTSSSSSSGMSSAGTKEDVPLEEVWTEQSIAVASGSSGGSPTHGGYGWSVGTKWS